MIISPGLIIPEKQSIDREHFSRAANGGIELQLRVIMPHNFIQLA
jgi:hypothetical protein